MHSPLRTVLALMLLISAALSSVPSPLSAAPERSVVVLSPGARQGTAAGMGTTDLSGDTTEESANVDVALQAREFLLRCPVDVYLTYEGEGLPPSPGATASLVSLHQPDVAVALYTLPLDGKSGQGPAAWYTVGGQHDQASKRLAQILAGRVAGTSATPGRGARAETEIGAAGGHIRTWQAPAAAVEVGEAGLLPERRRDLARAVAAAVLEYLELPLACGDLAQVKGIAIDAVFAREQKPVPVSLLNDGLLAWEGAGFRLAPESSSTTGSRDYPLPRFVKPGEIVSWAVAAPAPPTAGIYVPAWQLQRDGVDIPGGRVTAHLLVMPRSLRLVSQRGQSHLYRWRIGGDIGLGALLLDAGTQALTKYKLTVRQIVEQGCPMPAAIIFCAVGIMLARRPRPG